MMSFGSSLVPTSFTKSALINGLRSMHSAPFANQR
ncbi:hypothetical protein MUK42_15683 [Musa troglodytarum]|uniref:Uncharacterized protein n=1 Tax=Musa troglodytarum TaxID=320322 RepID=A0A9E7L4N7_9LILI|nr:hypothetical protein MUK42_15683 [Musa troglodytarum]